MPDYIKLAKSVLKNPTIRRMPTAYKLFWVYVMTNCDQSGVWIVDWDEAAYYTGERIDPQRAKDLFLSVDDESENPKAVEFDRGRKWLLPKFANYQISGIANNGKWAASIRKDWIKHGLDPETLRPFEKKNGETLNQPLDNPSDTLSKDYTNPLDTLSEDYRKTPLILSNLNSSIEILDNSESSIISIGGMQGGMQGGNGNLLEINFPPNFFEEFLKRFQSAYGNYGFPWKTREVIEQLRYSVRHVMGKSAEIGQPMDYMEAASFLCDCAELAQKADMKARQDKRKAPHNWLADHNYMSNPLEAVKPIEKQSQIEKMDEAIRSVLTKHIQETEAKK